MAEVVSEPKAFKPYVPDDAIVPELTFRAIGFGMLFGVIFGAVTVYVGLRAGLTVSASIPIAVLSISVLRALGKASILENNIVQTTGSAGESVAGGVIFTLPALIFLGFGLDYMRILVLSLIGGFIGVLFMIPLRRQLIVQEHGKLLYPEGAACADVLIAGEKGGSFASRVFYGLGLGGLYTLIQNSNAFAMVNELPTYAPKFFPGAMLRISTTAEYLGVGYIIGPRIAGVIFAGGLASWCVLMPMIKFFGSSIQAPLFPGTIPIADMTSPELYTSYVRYIGAGAVAAAGLITLLRTIPTVISALTSSLVEIRKSRGRGAAGSVAVGRTSDDLPITVVLGGSLVIIVAMWSMLTFMPIPGAPTGMLANLIASLLVLVFGFLFVTVSSRICGLIGTSSNPISGMTIATLMATCGLFLIVGWTAAPYGALALMIGGSVCIAAANGGNTSQDLKTGFLVGATPRAQQIGLMAGVLASCFAIGATLIVMNKGLEKFVDTKIAVDLSSNPEGVKIETESFDHDGRAYTLLNVIGSPTIPEGKYLFDRSTGQVEKQWIQGIGSDQAAAPQARLMSVVINGILTQKLPWGLVLIGAFLVLVVELLGVRSLSFAVGAYLPIGTSVALFLGGVVRWLAERGQENAAGDDETSPGALYASGLIAAGGIIGLLAVAVKALETTKKFPENMLHIGSPFEASDAVGVLAFAILAFSLYYFARKPLPKSDKP
ncbi:MAG: oligopeptide transporter, OPT family [Vicinamibacteria bacterium]